MISASIRPDSKNKPTPELGWHGVPHPTRPIKQDKDKTAPHDATSTLPSGSSADVFATQEPEKSMERKRLEGMMPTFSKHPLSSKFPSQNLEAIMPVDESQLQDTSRLIANYIVELATQHNIFLLGLCHRVTSEDIKEEIGQAVSSQLTISWKLLSLTHQQRAQSTTTSWPG